MHDTLRAPCNSKITGLLVMPCQERVASNGDICGRSVEIHLEGYTFDQIQDVLNDDILDRCPECRLAYLERIHEEHYDDN